jgi:DNA repair protein RadC
MTEQNLKIKELVVKYKSTRENAFNVSSPGEVYKFLKKKIGDEPEEVFVALYLNTKNMVVAYRPLARGTINEAMIHPREVFKYALLANCASVIVAHNHPSGSVTPSREDISVTQRLLNAGKVIGIELLDHVIVTDKSYESLKESGHI